MRRSLVALAVLASLALTSCGGNDKKEASDKTTSEPSSSVTPSATPNEPTETEDAAPDTEGGKTEAAARATVRAYIDGFFGNEVSETCALMTPKYIAQNVKDSKDYGVPADASCEQAIQVGMQFALAIKAKSEYFKVTKATVEGDTATVLTTATHDLQDTTYTLKWNGSRWLVDSDKSTP